MATWRRDGWLFAASSALRLIHSASLPWGRDVTPSLWGYSGDQLSTALAHRKILAVSTEDKTKAQNICCLREQTPKPCPSLHPGLPCCMSWPNAISSGHDMWHLMIHTAWGAEPSDTRPPQFHSDSTQGGFGVHLTFPGCCHPGAGHCPPLPTGSQVPAQLPWPCSSLLPQTFHQSAFSLQ